MALTQVPGSCNGRNVSPALAWSGEPASTQNFALTMVDTDARNGRGPVAFERVQYSGLGHGLAAGAGSAGLKDFPAALSYRKYGFGTSVYGPFREEAPITWTFCWRTAPSISRINFSRSSL